MGINFLLLLVSFYVVIDFFPLVARNPFDKYFLPFLVFIPIWFLSGVSFRKYRSYRYRKMKEVIWAIVKADLLAITVSLLLIFIFPQLDNLSHNVIIAIVTFLFVLEIFTAIIYYSFRYAVNIEQYENQSELSINEEVIQKDKLLDEETQTRIRHLIAKELGAAALNALWAKVQIAYANTIVISTTSVFNINNLKNNRYSTIVNLHKVNDIRGINEFFIAAHDRLPSNGLFVGLFRSKSAYKKDFLDRYPAGINIVLYSLNFFVKRILPKLGVTREIYFWLTGGKRRILTKAEVYGRLYCCGFEIVDEFKCDRYSYFIARKVKEPIRSEVSTYGPIIRLNRVGKNGKLIKVYKFRTMHPFSEYLQPYIFEKNSLKEGGKINRDFRVTSLGRFMRRFWLDELPMLLNFLKGDMKLVGVRPISKHYFSLYSKDLQVKRTKAKPGLLPPFYADMPKTLLEIEASELKYLNSCEKNGTFITDFSYFWRIMGNIFIRKARSN